MGRFRTFLVLVAVAIPLGWFVYRDAQRPPGDAGPARDKVFAVEADAIEEITVRSAAGDETRLRKSGTEWQIVSPATAQPDAAEVSGLTSNLATLEIQRVVDEKPADLKEYGLAEPRFSVAFQAGGEQHTLLVGEKTPPGTDLYATRAGDPAVFLIASYLESTFNRGTFDLRDKAALKVDRDKVDAIEIASGNRTLRFDKPAGEWRIAAPVAARADFSAVESLVSRFANLQARSVIDPPAAEAKTFGFEKPAATVRLSSGSSQAALVLGGPGPDDTVYARDSSRAPVFTVEASVLEELKKDPADFRQKDLFDARSFNATRLEIARAGQTRVFEKTTAKNAEGQDEETWRQVAPEARDVEQGTVQSLLSVLTTTRATGFRDAAVKALAAPELTVAVKYDEGKKEERVAFARAGGDAYASRDGEPGAAAIDGPTLDAIVKALEELK